MPEYTFKCKECDTLSTFEYRLRDIAVIKHNAIMQECKKCKKDLRWSDVQIEFQGGINMNSNDVGVAKRKYSNKAGGPRPFVNGKFKPDMKPKW
jgi:predicted nucleic acid-binding Zn ribbon protein